MLNNHVALFTPLCEILGQRFKKNLNFTISTKNSYCAFKWFKRFRIKVTLELFKANLKRKCLLFQI